MKIKPWLLLPANLSHKLAPYYLKLASTCKTKKTLNWKTFKWRNLNFSNPLGIAGGVDKDAESIKGWWSYGTGFIEVGTITPEPQNGNSGKVMGRNIKEMAIWNRMGFPSKGCLFAENNLKKIPKPHFTPIFINIGKNRTTSLENAHLDYIHCIKKLSPYADAFVINISSPNTPNLRDLLLPERLFSFLLPLVEFNKKNQSIPLILKISPDINGIQLESVLKTSLKLNLDGWILNNTSLQRPKNIDFPIEGGLSGKPINEISKSTLKKALHILGKDREGKLIISTGGVLSPEDVFERLELGADLVQVYTSLIFNGLNFFNHVNSYAHRN